MNHDRFGLGRFMRVLLEQEPSEFADIYWRDLSDTTVIERLCEKYGVDKPTGATPVHEHLDKLADAIELRTT